MKISEYPKKQRATVWVRYGRKDISNFMRACDMIGPQDFITGGEHLCFTFTANEEVNIENFSETLKAAFDHSGYYVIELDVQRVEDI